MNAGNKYLIIVNPISGSGNNSNIIPRMKEAFPVSQIKISDHKGHPYEIALLEDLTQFDALVTVGGDGTMHEIINGMMDRKDGKKLPIGLIPGGTGNSFMHDLGCLNPLEAIDIISGGHIKKIDLMKVQAAGHIRHAFNIVGWGMAVTINNFAEKWRGIGSQRYNLASVYEIFRNPKWPVKIRLDDDMLQGDFSFFLACNTMYSGNGMKVAPRAMLDDGLIDVLLLKQAPRFKMIGIFSKIFTGNHIKSSLIEYRQVKSFSIVPEVDSVLNIDGQVTGSTPVNVSTLPKSLEIFYPE